MEMCEEEGVFYQLLSKSQPVSGSVSLGGGLQRVYHPSPVVLLSPAHLSTPILVCRVSKIFHWRPDSFDCVSTTLPQLPSARHKSWRELEMFSHWLGGKWKGSKLTSLPSNSRSRATHHFTRLVAYSPGCSGFSRAVVPGKEVSGRGDARVRRTLMEILVQVVPTPSFSLQEILVVSIEGLVAAEELWGQGWGIRSLHKLLMKAFYLSGHQWGTRENWVLLLG